MRSMVLAALASLAFLLSLMALGWLMTGEPLSLYEVATLPLWLVAVAATYVVLLRRTERLGWRPLATLGIPYAIASLVGGVARLAIEIPIRLVPGLHTETPASLVLVFGTSNSVGFLGLWMLFYAAPRAIEESRRAERERQELLRDAERIRVRSTLEPHFVLNTLNTIAGLVTDDPHVARELIAHLGDLLRDVVQRAAQDTATVRDEVAWLQRYAAILETRHAGRLGVTWDVDAGALDIAMPVMLLQPILENAIQHGALQRPEGGTVAVTVRCEPGALRCEIADDGPGVSGGVAVDAGAGVGSGAGGGGGGRGNGVELTRRRLRLEAQGSTFDFASGPTGTRVTVSLPVPPHVSASASAAPAPSAAAPGSGLVPA